MTAFVTLSFGPSHMSVQDMKIFNQMLSKVVRQTEYEAQGDPAISEIKGGAVHATQGEAICDQKHFWFRAAQQMTFCNVISRVRTAWTDSQRRKMGHMGLRDREMPL